MNNQTSPQASSSPSPLSLFDIIVSDATAQRTSVVPAETLNVAPPTIEIVTIKKMSYNDVFVRYEQAMKRLGAVINDQITLENQLFGTSLTERPSTQCISKVGDAAVKALISKAERMFAPPGGKLSISEFQCLKAIGQGNWAENYRSELRYRKDHVGTPIGLDLDVLWAHLETTYGGDSGKNAGYRQQAAVIVDAFSLENDGVVKRSTSSVSLFMYMYSQKQDYGDGKGKYQAHYSSREALAKRFQALICFAEWANLVDLSIDLQPSKHNMCGYHMYYSPRESRSFSGLNVVMFKDKWEFKFNHDVAEKLMLFLGEFSASQA